MDANTTFILKSVSKPYIVLIESQQKPVRAQLANGKHDYKSIVIFLYTIVKWFTENLTCFAPTPPFHSVAFKYNEIIIFSQL